MVSRENIYLDCANTKFWKARIRLPYPVRESSCTNKSKYWRFYRSHDHNTGDCVQLKDAMIGWIKKSRLSEYVKGRIDREESPNSKSPSNTADVRPSSDNKEAYKGKCSYTAFVTTGARKVCLSNGR